MNYLWDQASGVVKDESIMFAGTNHAELAYPAVKIISLTNTVSGITYLPGKDFLHIKGNCSIELAPGSRIVPVPMEELYPPTEKCIFYPNKNANALPSGIDQRNLRFSSKDFFLANQFEVDYQTDSELLIDFAPRQKGTLRRSIDKLRKKESLRLTFIGDSITEGWNASKFVKVHPFRPCYAEQLAIGLEKNYQTKVIYRNYAIGGTGCRQAVEIEEKYLAEPPDLLVIAYGMNDFNGMTADHFGEVISSIMARARKRCPGIEFLLVSSMPGNREWAPTRPGPDARFHAELKAVAETVSDAALADVRTPWIDLLNRKKFFDMTGNGVNHPNDYGHRLYASVLLSLLTEEE
ncbi:MAG: SGNH/GDSL hydrolase family protein [Victivallaceae bacterium]|nr:SGNH/GDSL hydrolase family protein [Victivallaceae bacterium]